MRKVYGFLALLLLGVALVTSLAMTSEGIIIIPPCGPEQRDLFCARYCNTDYKCWGPAQATQACIEVPEGCIEAPNSPCCTVGGGF